MLFGNHKNSSFASEKAARSGDRFRFSSDLILLDIMLPEMRGTEIMTAIRKFEKENGERSHIIVMTNFDQDEKSRTALENDADAYLIKAEITPRRLIEIIQQLDN
ncbi:hypothetical protein G112A_00234 [Candidatus Nanosynsacchari sp. TM7_G1_3_12Alb]|nr:hypothetical protein G112A_00234 [Candidatus Nanosynsacchari sp. TM7_G1_3_12Alb]